MEKILYEKILYYLNKGWNVIPVNFLHATEKNGKIVKDVKFLPSYEEFHSRMVKQEEIENLWKGYNGVAIITGKISGITVMDVDSKDLKEITELPETFTVETRKGFHFYFKHTEEVITSKEKFKGEGYDFNIDIRNNGGIIFADPSEYELPDKTITKYKIIKDLPLAEFPSEWLKKVYQKYNPEKIKNGEIKTSSFRDNFEEGFVDGTRNDFMFRYFCSQVSYQPQSDWEKIVWANGQAYWEKHFKGTDYTLQECRASFLSACKYQRQQEAQSKVGETYIYANDLGFKTKTITESGYVYCDLSEILTGAQSIDCVLNISIETRDGMVKSFNQRIDLMSSSAIATLTAKLNRTHGGRKEKGGYNWDLILNNVILKVNEELKKQQKPQFFFDREYVEPRFLFFPFIQDKVANILFGQSEVGKSFWALRLAISLANGSEFLGFKPNETGKSLYLDYEDDETTFISRLYGLCAGEGLDYKEIAKEIGYYKPLGEIKFTSEIIRRMIVENNIKLMIIDAGGDAAGSPSKEDSVLSMFNTLKTIPCAVLLLHHEPKNIINEDQAYYGSMYWKGRSRVGWRIETEKELNGVKTIKMSVQKRSNMGQHSNIYYNFSYCKPNPLISQIPTIQLTKIDMVVEENTTQEFIERALSGGERLTYRQIANIIDRKENAVKSALKRLHKQGKVKNVDELWFIPQK